MEAKLNDESLLVIAGTSNGIIGGLSGGANVMYTFFGDPGGDGAYVETKGWSICNCPYGDYRKNSQIGNNIHCMVKTYSDIPPNYWNIFDPTRKRYTYKLPEECKQTVINVPRATKNYVCDCPYGRRRTEGGEDKWSGTDLICMVTYANEVPPRYKKHQFLDGKYIGLYYLYTLPRFCRGSRTNVAGEQTYAPLVTTTMKPSRWIDGGEYKSCTTACEDIGLICPPRGFYDNQGDVRNSDKFVQLIKDVEGPDYFTGCEMDGEYSNFPASPYWKELKNEEKCVSFAKKRNEDSFDCDKQPGPEKDKKHRLCY